MVPTNVRLVPLATNAPQQTADLFDHLVGERKQLRRHIETERLDRLQIDDELEFRRQQNRQIGDHRAFKNFPQYTPACRVASAMLVP